MSSSLSREDVDFVLSALHDLVKGDIASMRAIVYLAKVADSLELPIPVSSAQRLKEAGLIDQWQPHGRRSARILMPTIVQQVARAAIVHDGAFPTEIRSSRKVLAELNK